MRCTSHPVWGISCSLGLINHIPMYMAWHKGCTHFRVQRYQGISLLWEWVKYMSVTYLELVQGGGWAMDIGHQSFIISYGPQTTIIPGLLHWWLWAAWLWLDEYSLDYIVRSDQMSVEMVTSWGSSGFSGWLPDKYAVIFLGLLFS
jgi:hypothetical protein